MKPRRSFRSGLLGNIWQKFQLETNLTPAYKWSEWLMFKSSITEAAARSWGQKAVGACHSANCRKHCWTPGVGEAVKWKDLGFQEMLKKGSPDSFERYRRA